MRESGGLGESVDQLRTRVEKIEQRLRSIEERQSGQMPTPPPIDGAPAGGEVDADDIPFHERDKEANDVST